MWYGAKNISLLCLISTHRKIGILGGSYGGYMTVAALCFHPDEFKTGVDLFGVVNWPQNSERNSALLGILPQSFV